MRVRDKVQGETGRSLSLQEMGEANTISEQIIDSWNFKIAMIPTKKTNLMVRSLTS